MDLREELSTEEIKSIEDFLEERFEYFDTLRKPYDDLLIEERQLYNNQDKYVDAKTEDQEKVKVRYFYTIAQTMVARIEQSLFGHQNYVKAFGEGPETFKIERPLARFVQAECDKLRIKSRAREFIEDALIEGTNWIQLRPVKTEVNGQEFLQRVDFDTYGWIDVWFDLKALQVEDSDFFVRKTVKLWKIKGDEQHYFNTEDLAYTIPPDFIQEQQKYEANNEEISYYDPSRNNMTDKLELLEWYGEYDFGTENKPDFQHVIFTWANRTRLIRAETTDLNTRRKTLIFPIRPLKRARSLRGTRLGELVKDPQYELNEIRSLRMDNFKTLVKLLFKANKNGGIDMNELSAKGGNVIHFEDDPNDITTFDVPNMVGIASAMSSETIQDMQQITGAVDYLMGTSAGKGITETASGINKITEQAMFKMSAMSENCDDDIVDMLHYLLILWVKFNPDYITSKFPELTEFVSKNDENTLEDNYYFDFAMVDLSQRRDVERSQFINAMNILLPIFQQMGLNMGELVRQFAERLGMTNIEEILSPAPQMQQIQAAMAQNPQLMQMVQMILQNPQLMEQVMAALGQPSPPQTGNAPGAGRPATPQVSAATPEEQTGETSATRKLA